MNFWSLREMEPPELKYVSQSEFNEEKSSILNAYLKKPSQ